MTMQYLKPEFLIICYLLVLVPVLMWKGKMPSIHSIGQLAQILNSRGGNIVLLGSFTMFFFIAAARYIYFTIGLLQPGLVMTNETIRQMGMTFFTSTAFSSFAGALLKTMTGEDLHTAVASVTDKPSEEAKQ